MTKKSDSAEALAFRMADVARVSGISLSTVKRLVKRRELPSLRVGKIRLVRRRDLEIFLEGRVNA
jgi:excisionase family DNA binding protein